MNKLKNDDIINILLDKNNNSDIVMNDNYGTEVIFEQMATIPYYDKYTDKTDIYCILHPKSNSKEFKTGFIYPFLVKKDGKDYSLEAVEDEELLKELDKIYNELE